MAAEGIAKDRKNNQQGYSFRGIDDVYNALSPVIAKNNLCILPNVLERNVVERQSAKGGTLFYVTVKARFDFVSAEDGSKHEVVTYGEAMDSADKATNKAMSAAYKYAAMQAFCIPTEGDNDADAHTHQIAPAEQLLLSESSILNYIADIKACVDMTSLQTAFANAYKTAQSFKHQEAMTRFKNAYEGMKAELTTKAGV